MLIKFFFNQLIPKLFFLILLILLISIYLIIPLNLKNEKAIKISMKELSEFIFRPILNLVDGIWFEEGDC